ncbi:Zn(II)2Cys6 transcription factor domain-containing protein [Aspergillus melleus]|uniref:Zn(II)2Cys6 transcription factor domain-containing protein n=1 Tax=Aspergillus melleus TaxID=138277 RepID=UPI001E8D7A89|nr:uncharacterized protein LDX57_005162 [Aspergillus melleus]KAH8427449.1 hypothetical protein LDX57_005162 [Aspergillus melleus]
MPDQRRPYRSHKVPACDRCRRFKRRCTGGSPDRPCVLCHLQEVPCLISASPKAQAGVRRSSRREQRRVLPKQTPSNVNVTVHATPSQADPDVGQDERIGTDYHGSPTQDRSKIELSMVASPVISEDIQILERYMSSKASSSMPVSVDGSLSHAGANPMVYLRVPRRREGLAMSENPGKQQKEILRQILKPYADELVRL